MSNASRRDAMRAGLAGAIGATSLATGSAAMAQDCPPAAGSPVWRRGVEGQRRADLGDGTFLNPIMSGDRPDPTILKDGRDYYMTFSSFDCYPGVVIWRSQDLVNWTPVGPALHEPIGSVWACDLVKHDGRYFIYIPARTRTDRSIYVIHADRIEGPWSDPIDLHLPRHIDPGHAVGEDGRRYLFLSGGDRVALTDDGLSTAGPVEHVYDPWRYPDDWVVESFSPEGPKITRRGDYFYLITAVGGTAGPPTGHMVIAARSRSIHGPWEHCPHNPLVRTTDVREHWWSRGHASLVEGPDGDWWSVYHGYENGFWTLGRQTLLDRIEWTDDGWLRFLGGDLSRPMKKPRGGRALPHGAALSDDFRSDRFGVQWAFYDPGPDERRRAKLENGALVLQAKGSSPADCSPITCIAGDLSYRCEVEIEVSGGATGGVVLYYNRRMYCGLGFNEKDLIRHRTAIDALTKKPDGVGRRMFIRWENDRHIVTFHTSPDGRAWTKFGVQMEISGYHHNTAYDFLSVRPGLYAAGDGEVRFKNFKYTAL